MAFDINQFRTGLVGDGARANLFEVQLLFPSWVQLGGIAAAQSTFRVKAAQLPGSTIGLAPVYYFGREVKLAGNRTYQDWTVQIINDEDFNVKAALEQWHNGINSPTGNIRNPAASVIDGGYGVDAAVTQYGKTGLSIAQYQFIGIFPIDISPIEMEWSSNDTVEEFTATFAVQYYLSANAGDYSIAQT